MAKNTASIPAKITGSTYSAAEFEILRGFVDSPLQDLSTFDGSLILLDGSGSYDNFTMSANLNITFAESAHVEGSGKIVLITADGTDTLTLTKPSAFELYWPSTFTNGAILASGIHEISFWFISGAIQTRLQTLTKSGGDVTAPTITGIAVDADNGGVTVSFDEGCYANNDGTGDLVVADFTAGLSGGTATSPILTNPVHTAGDSSISFDLAYTGTADGDETLTITIVDNSCYDLAGNVMASGQNGTDGLNDQVLPTVSSATVENADPDALVVVLTKACTLTDMTALSLDGSWTGITIDSLTSGDGTNTFTFALSGPVANGETGAFVYGATNNIEDLETTPNGLAADSTTVTNNVGAGSIILLEDDFTGSTIDTAKWDLANPNSADLTISQNNKLLFTRTTDNAVVGSGDNLTSDNAYAKGGSLAVLVNKDVGFVDGTCLIRWVFNGTIDFIGVQKATGLGSNVWRLVIKQTNIIVYDFDTAISTSNRIKITYDSSNNIKFWYRNGAVWTQMGTTQTYDVGASGTILLTSDSSINDAINDVLSYDDLYVTDADYSTEVPT